MKSKNQKGFSVVEILILLVVAGVIAGGTWYVGKHNSETVSNSSAIAQPNNSQKTSSEQTYTDPSGFTLSYHQDWKFVAKGTMAGSGEFASDEFLPAANYPDNNGYSISFDKDTSSLSAEQYAKSQGPTEGIVGGENSTINGYSAYTENYKVPGPSGVPNGYKVVIKHNNRVVTFYYTLQDGYTDIYKAIINSIKFN